MPKPRPQKRPSPIVVHDRPSRWWLPPLLLVIVGAAVYANALRGPFLLDDQGAIVDNPSIRQLSSIGSVLHPPTQRPVTGRPVVNLSFALNYAVGGLKVEGYHATNIAIHILAAIALFGVLRLTFACGFRLKPEATGAAVPLALACALVWMVHPINTEAVNYVTQRSEALMGLFYLAALYAAIRALDPRAERKWISVAGLAAYCAVGSKETALTLPLIIVLWDRTFAFSTFREAWTRRWRLYAVVAASWLLFAIFARELPFFAERGFETDVSRWTYLLNQGPMIAQYLKLTVWPLALVFDYGPTPPVTLGGVWPSLLLVAVLLAAALVAIVRWPSLGFWGAWFFVTLAPPSSLIPIPTEVGAERRMYLPLVAVIALIGIGAWRLIGYGASRKQDAAYAPHMTARRAGLALQTRLAIPVALMIAVLGALTIRRNVEYQSDLGLWQSTLDRWPQPRAHEHLSMALRDAGRMDEAIAHLRTAAPDSPNARHALASALLDQGDVAGGIAQFTQFIAENPESRQIIVAREEFAVALVRAGDMTAALQQFEAITKAVPDYARGFVGLADVRLQMQDVPGAILALRRALQLQPNNVIALSNLGLLQAQSGEPQEAMALLKRAVTLEPRALPPRKQIARLLLAQRRFEEMASEARVLAAMAPDDAESHNLLGIALASLGQYAEAGARFERVLQLDPANVDARANLARLRALAPPAPARE